MQDIEVIVFERDGSKKAYKITNEDYIILKQSLNLSESKSKEIWFGKKRYFDVRDLAWSVLIECKVDRMPINLKTISNNFNWPVLSYQRNAKEIAILDKLELRKKTEGFCLEFLNHNIVCVDEIDNKRRLRWTIAHEFGHIALQHNDIKVNNYEEEAHMFARRILCPMGLLKLCNVESVQEIAEFCKISMPAAKNCMRRYKELLDRGLFFTSDLEVKMCEQFKGFIEEYNQKKLMLR